jgi:formyl-CoA transferase
MATPQSRYLVRDELDAIISEWTSRHTKQEAMDILCKADIPAGAVLDVEDLTNDEYLRSRGTMTEIEHPERGKLVVPGFAPKMSGNDLRYETSPALGEHNRKVYHDLLGLSDEEMAELKAKGVI